MSVAKRIIPCLDVDKGRVVKGVNFLNIRDAGDPVEIAKRYDTEGADEITMLDITASHETRDTTYKTVESIASQVFIPLTVGGGVRKIEDIKKLLRSGADKVTINTSAVENPSFVKEAADKFGSQCIVVAVDAKAKTDKENTWEVVTYGGRNRTGIDVLQWTEQVVEYGAGEILLTSMDRDGTKEGFDNENLPNVEFVKKDEPTHLMFNMATGSGKTMLMAACILHYMNLGYRKFLFITNQTNILDKK